ncbi:hypothetical protein [Mucilaginibacter humi]|uniref:hypothetical protein n=1 Tax=Mucilaginibacter humi TaxID=2732510 RepID=UPI0015854AD9|nr:hypothetical protein [Mucilaginibacter humi]
MMWLIVMFIGQPIITRFNPQVDLHYFAGYAGYPVLGHYLTFNINYSKGLVRWMWFLFWLY